MSCFLPSPGCPCIVAACGCRGACAAGVGTGGEGNLLAKLGASRTTTIARRPNRGSTATIAEGDGSTRTRGVAAAAAAAAAAWRTGDSPTLATRVTRWRAAQARTQRRVPYRGHLQDGQPSRRVRPCRLAGRSSSTTTAATRTTTTSPAAPRRGSDPGDASRNAGRVELSQSRRAQEQVAAAPLGETQPC